MNKVTLIVVSLLLTSCSTTTKTTPFESYPYTIGPFLENWGRPDSIIPISDRLTRLTWGPDKFVVDRRTGRRASSKDTSIPTLKVTAVFVIEEPNLNADVYKSVEEKRMSEEERQLLLIMLMFKHDVNENAIIPDTYPTHRTKYGINEDAIIQQSSRLHFTF